MKSYEGLFIFPPESTPDVRKAQLKNWEDTFQKFGCVIVQKTEWGKKPLGYPVRKFREGFFLVVDFQMDPSKAIEFRKNLELQEDLIKYMVTVKQEKKVKATATQPAAKPQQRPVPAAPAPASAS
jgi:small subunit ribosomal protein S6